MPLAGATMKFHSKASTAKHGILGFWTNHLVQQVSVYTISISMISQRSST